MSQQATFSSYGAAVAGGVDGGWTADSSTQDVFPTDLYPTVETQSSSADDEPTKYVTFGCVEYTPQE